MAPEEVRKLGVRETHQFGHLFFQSTPFRRKFIVGSNDFAQQARQKAQRKSPQRWQAVHRQFRCFWRICTKVIGSEITGEHYTSSEIDLPCANDGEKPNIAPSVGTRSTDSTTRS